MNIFSVDKKQAIRYWEMQLLFFFFWVKKQCEIRICYYQTKILLAITTSQKKIPTRRQQLIGA